MNWVTVLIVFIISLVKLSTQFQLSIAFPPGVTNYHPTPSPNKVQYIIGYGSLINTASKNKTSPDTGINIPVRISGFKRTWTAKGKSNFSLSTTFLGVDIDPKSSLNGVIFSVPTYKAVEKYDMREMGYCRVPVPWNDVTILRGNVSDNGTFPNEYEQRNSQFWIYATSPTFREFPDEKYPIVQSYVDIFLGGCIQLERKYGLQNYSLECVTQTEGWEYPWVNDRIHPRRPFAYQPDARSVDTLISRTIPDHKSRIYLERIYVTRSDGCGHGPLSSSMFLMYVFMVLILSC